MQKVRDLGTFSPKWNVYVVKSLPSELKLLHGTECRKGVTKRGSKTPRNQGPLNQHDKISYELTETEAACIGFSKICTSVFVYILLLSVKCFPGRCLSV